MVMYTIVNYLFVDKLYKIIGEVFTFADNININDYFILFYFVGTNVNYDGKEEMWCLWQHI